MCSTALKSVARTRTERPLQTAEIVSYKWVLTINPQTGSTSNTTRHIKSLLIRFDSFQVARSWMDNRTNYILTEHTQPLSFSTYLPRASLGDRMGLYGHECCPLAQGSKCLGAKGKESNNKIIGFANTFETTCPFLSTLPLERQQTSAPVEENPRTIESRTAAQHLNRLFIQF